MAKFSALSQILLFLALFSHGLSASGYTFSCWQNGWRKNANDQSQDIFGIETSQYGFTLNLADFTETQFGRIPNQPSYETALNHKADKLSKLPKADFQISIETKGKHYTASSCAVAKATGVKKRASVRLWESGRFVQHYDMLGLQFQNPQGELLDCDARLDLFAWPDSLTFTLHLTPQEDWSQTSMDLRLTSPVGKWSQSTKIQNWKSGEEKTITLTCHFQEKNHPSPNQVTVSHGSGPAIPIQFDRQKNCLIASVNRLKRSWKSGYTDIRDYDEFKISISGGTESQSIPFLLDLRSPANITGICPILCYEDGTPTGIPVQLSKNWHYKPIGSYLMAYAMLPAGGPKTYLLRLAYGFYGSLPSASHAQLSLIGYGGKHAGNGRWDQLAIGCWGESICFDMDMSLVDVSITDIRLLMGRDGLKGKKWGWTEAGWGGDWLNIKDQNQQKYFQNHLKTAYITHGPCLTKVKHEGFYGENQEVDFTAEIQTLRTDDYCRTFQNLRYTFTKKVSAEKISLFKIGRSFHYHSPKVVYGNLNGLIAEHEAPESLKQGQFFLKDIHLDGLAPHWIAFPGALLTTKGKPKPNGYRALIIRDYQAILGGRTYTTPVLQVPVHQANPTNLDLELIPPDGIHHFQEGDQIHLGVELITLPRVSADYYGPNEHFRHHLATHPNSWKTTHREARGNDFKVSLSGGQVIKNYPLVIEVEEPEVSFTIQGGVGAVPVQLQKLCSPKGGQLIQIIDGKRIPFDQSVHGNDFWQTDYEPLSQTYSMTFNLPLDGLSSSRWIFKAPSHD
ncbi:MAG: hypothetical protein ACON5H_10195 [Akkermansiaceae bacterium]